MPPSGTPMSIAHARADRRRVLVPRGTNDLDTAPRLFVAFARAIRGREPLAVDLREVDVADGRGIALVVNAVRRLHHQRREIVVVCPPGAVRTAFEQTGLARRIDLVDDPRALHGHGHGPGPVPAPPARRFTERAEQRRSTPARRGALLAEATLAIELRHGDPTLSVEDVARHIATSTRQLQRVFSELAGGAFRSELAAVRMQHGAVLLQTTTLSVAEIALRVGYRQAAQFAKASAATTACRRALSAGCDRKRCAPRPSRAEAMTG